MKLAVLIPDRGDRPEFMRNCMRMLRAQTLKPDVVEIVDDPPFSGDCDITWRYRTGYDRLRNRRIDLIAMMENDDWYHPEYLETMVRNWRAHGCPNLFGTRATLYYHIELFRHMTMNHHTRSSAMSTLIKPDMNFVWCHDAEPYADAHIWSVIKGGITHTPEKMICIGIKHGIGLCGGKSHTTALERYLYEDHDHRLLRKHMDSESFEFYTNYFKNQKPKT